MATTHKDLLTSGDVEHRFAFHAATTEEKRDEHTSVRKHCENLGQFLLLKLPDSRERALAMTKLEEVMFWANAAIARNNDGR